VRRFAMTMTKTNVFLGVVMAAALTTQAGQGQTAAPPKPGTLGLFVYPAKGQDATKQGADEGECYGWARQQTGIDPTVATAAAEVEEKRGGAVKGAARGAARVRRSARSPTTAGPGTRAT
jgi:hypothetical protein